MSAFENCDCPLCLARRRAEFYSAEDVWCPQWEPKPWWRRMTRWDWLYVAVCLAGAAACWWGMR